jgi:hypothetical protein
MFDLMRWNRRLCSPRNVLLVLVICTSSLSAQMSMRGRAQSGRVLFHSSALGNNGLACIDCHADFDEARLGDGLIRAGHSLYGAASRQTYWGQEEDDPDRYPDVAHAAVFCVEHFMRNPEKLTTQQLFDLQTYLRSINRRPMLTDPPRHRARSGQDRCLRRLRGWRSYRWTSPVLRRLSQLSSRRQCWHGSGSDHPGQAGQLLRSQDT